MADDSSSDEEEHFFFNMKPKSLNESNNNQKQTTLEEPPSEPDQFLAQKRKNSVDKAEENDKKKNNPQEHNRKPSNKSKRSIGNKDQICQFYINGACKKGENCPFSHNCPQIHKRELCKFFLSGYCTKGSSCLYSHNLKDYPCKFYHARGFCENFENCKFSHKRLNEDEINLFIKENEDFLMETKKKFGRTNMDDFFNQYLMKKNPTVPSNAMLPEILKNENVIDPEKEKSNNENFLNTLPLGFSMILTNPKILQQFQMNLQTFMAKQMKEEQQKNKLNPISPPEKKPETQTEKIIKKPIKEDNPIKQVETIKEKPKDLPKEIKKEENLKKENATNVPLMSANPFQNPLEISNDCLESLFFVNK